MLCSRHARGSEGFSHAAYSHEVSRMWSSQGQAEASCTGKCTHQFALENFQGSKKLEYSWPSGAGCGFPVPGTGNSLKISLLGLLLFFARHQQMLGIGRRHLHSGQTGNDCFVFCLKAVSLRCMRSEALPADAADKWRPGSWIFGTCSI